MKFVMIILFATAGDIYMFTDPTFDSKNECMSFLMNNGPSLNEKIIQEYGYPKQVQAVNCMREQQFLDIISGLTKT